MDEVEYYYWFSIDGTCIEQMKFSDWFKWYKYVIYKYNNEEEFSITTWNILDLLISISVVVHNDFIEAFYYLRDDLIEIREEIQNNNKGNGRTLL